MDKYLVQSCSFFYFYYFFSLIGRWNLRDTLIGKLALVLMRYVKWVKKY